MINCQLHFNKRILKGYRVAFFISPPILRLSVPYRPTVDRMIRLRLIQSTLRQYGTLSLDTGGDMKKVTR